MPRFQYRCMWSRLCYCQTLDEWNVSKFYSSIDIRSEQLSLALYNFKGIETDAFSYPFPLIPFFIAGKLEIETYMYLLLFHLQTIHSSRKTKPHCMRDAFISFYLISNKFGYFTAPSHKVWVKQTNMFCFILVKFAGLWQWKKSRSYNSSAVYWWWNRRWCNFWMFSLHLINKRPCMLIQCFIP